jgi:hypothetical protein
LFLIIICTMPPSRLESLPRELRELIYFHLDIPVAGECVHNCVHQVACTVGIDERVAPHPRAPWHYVDIWDEIVRAGGLGQKILRVRSVGINGKIEGIDVFKSPVVGIAPPSLDL